MSSTQTSPRLLETSVRQFMVDSRLVDEVALRLQGESDDRSLPAIVISAKATGEELGLLGTAGEGYGATCELKLDCLVSSDAQEGPRLVKELAERARESIESPTSVTGWLVLILEYQGSEPTVDEKQRTITLTYNVTCLPEAN